MGRGGFMPQWWCPLTTYYHIPTLPIHYLQSLSLNASLPACHLLTMLGCCSSTPNSWKRVSPIHTSSTENENGSFLSFFLFSWKWYQVIPCVRACVWLELPNPFPSLFLPCSLCYLVYGTVSFLKKKILKIKIKIPWLSFSHKNKIKYSIPRTN